MSKPTTTTAAPFAVTASYLMWVGAEHYGKIEDYTGEVVKQGVSKRVANVHIAKSLMAPGTVIFLAHDEHSYTECPECTGSVQCGECRKRGVEAQRIEAEISDLQEKLGAVADDAEVGTEDTAKETARLSRLINNRIEKVKTLVAASKECDLCDGHGFYNGGTGGRVIVDDAPMDYRTYNYWLHQPKVWSPEGHTVTTEMCECCGGTGRLPEGKVFGCILPSDIEYILPDGDEDAKLKAEAAGFKTVSTVEVAREEKRGCGKRHVGGYYIRTGTRERAEDTKALVEKLVADGVVTPEGVDVVGTFIRFTAPIDIPGVKRFRGLKTWSLDPVAEEEVEMAVEALSDAA